jgi:hypothetical protein
MPHKARSRYRRLHQNKIDFRLVEDQKRDDSSGEPQRTRKKRK